MSLLFNVLSRLLITFLSRKVMFSWKKKCFGINIYVSKNVLELTFIAVYWEDFHSFDPRAFLHLAFSKHLLRQELFKASESSSSVQFSSVTQLCPTLWPHESQHARPPCPSPTPGVHSNSCPSSRWHSHPLSSPSPPAPKASSIRVFSKEPTLRMRWPKYWSFSFSISPSKEHAGLISFKWTGWISLQSKGLSRVFSNTTVQKHQFFGAQLSSQSNFHIHTWPLEKP